MTPIRNVINALLRKRQLTARIANTTATTADQYEVFTVKGPFDFYQPVKTMKQAILLANHTAHRAPGTVVSVWSPQRCHVYQAVVDGETNRLRVPHGPADLRTASPPSRSTSTPNG